MAQDNAKQNTTVQNTDGMKQSANAQAAKSQEDGKQYPPGQPNIAQDKTEEEKTNTSKSDPKLRAEDGTPLVRMEHNEPADGEHIQYVHPTAVNEHLRLGWKPKGEQLVNVSALEEVKPKVDPRSLPDRE